MSLECSIVACQGAALKGTASQELEAVACNSSGVQPQLLLQELSTQRPPGKGKDLLRMPCLLLAQAPMAALLERPRVSSLKCVARAWRPWRSALTCVNIVNDSLDVLRHTSLLHHQQQ